MKEYRKRMILTSFVTIIPMFVGLLLWNKLPDTMATHFGSNNTPNGWSSKTFAVIGLPLLLLVLHWISVGITLNDPEEAEYRENDVYGYILDHTDRFVICEWGNASLCAWMEGGYRPDHQYFGWYRFYSVRELFIKKPPELYGGNQITVDIKQRRELGKNSSHGVKALGAGRGSVSGECLYSE